MAEGKQDINVLADHLFRENSGKMVAALSRIFTLSNIDTIMDVVHDAFEAALITWRYKGVPDNPEGWLMQVAKNKAINTFKRESKVSRTTSSAFNQRQENSIEAEVDRSFLPGNIEDSQLRLLLTCCHPELSAKNQVILTLYILCGFGKEEIANALLMKGETVKKVLTRSKATLKVSRDLLHVPLLPELEERVEVVHTILYLIFNEGYKPTRSKQLINHDLCYEAIRLTKLLLNDNVALFNESNALLALMFFGLARFPARHTSEGEIVILLNQDRTKWNKVYIDEAFYYLKKATNSERISRYHLEAIIASIHCSSPSFDKTDWQKLVFLYRQLELINLSPMTTLNRIMAESYVLGPVQSLPELQKLKQEKTIEGHYLLHAAEGDLCYRSGKYNMAKHCYEQALYRASSDLDRSFLNNKICECAAKGAI